nr:restriction endonuclease subunit S [Lactobacillus gasseri]
MLAWEQRKLKDITQRVEGNNGNMNLPVLTISAKQGWMTQSNRFSSIIAGAEKKKYTLLKKGNLSYNHGNSKIAPFGTVFMLKTYSEALVPKVYHSFKAKKDINPYFLEVYFQTRKMDPQLRKYISSSARMDGLLNITYSWFEQVRLFLPNIEEQNKLEKLFDILNKHIELQQRKLKLIKLFEKEAIKQVYNHKLKFNFDKLEWQKVMLKELAHISTGKLDANAMIKNGKYDFYTSGIKKYKTDTFKFNGPAITIAGNGATVGFMHIADGKFNAYQRTYVLFKLKCNRTFLFYEIQEKLPAKIHSESRTGNIPYIVKEMLTDLEIEIPSIFVQNNIAHYETYLKNITILNERKVDTLLKLKQFLLQNMFI